MKCKKCQQKAVIELKRHNSAFCREHFLEYFQNQVQRAIKKFSMFRPSDRILVAISGGKDSLALWDVLLRLGYQADGLYIDLGIGDYSQTSGDKSKKFAEQRNANLRYVSLEEKYGFDVPDATQYTNRPACSACGLSKRYLFNREALDGGYNAIATGHNLDDEAATLLGNVLGWKTEALARQYPVLEGNEKGFARKTKPLIRLSERETAAYCVLTGIDYIVEECPNAVGARSHLYKELLNNLEKESPGMKQKFLMEFLERGSENFTCSESGELNTCQSCGHPTSGDICAFCRMTEQLLSRKSPAEALVS
jgi:uncharacterized protein (TIGR00269 family)